MRRSATNCGRTTAKRRKAYTAFSGRNPNSRFYLSLRVSYPSAEDRREAAEKGFSPGGDIMIHGLPNKAPFLGSAHLLRDWTAGCIAVTNEEIEEIWSMVADGTTIEILP